MKLEKGIKSFFTSIYLICSLVFVLITGACSTLPPVGGTVSAPRVYSSLEVVEPEWEPLANGVWYFHGKIDSPRLEFWALRIDLNAPGVNIVVNSNAGTVSGFVRGNNLIAGINASPFDENHRNMGVVVSGGTMHSSPVSRYDALVFYRDRQSTRAAIVNQADISAAENIDAIGGYHRILADGQPAQRTLREGNVSSQRHPRSAAGVSSDGRILYLLVIDGRRSGSVGAAELETALLLRALGSNEGLNLDGGGSTALAIRYSDGIVRTVNTPGGLGRERSVSSTIGISSP